MKFRVDGGVDLSARQEPQIVRDAIKLCESLPDGDLLSTHGLMAKLGRSRTTASHNTTHPKLEAFRFKLGNGKVYYGNPRTIQQARIEFANQG